MLTWCRRSEHERVWPRPPRWPRALAANYDTPNVGNANALQINDLSAAAEHARGRLARSLAANSIARRLQRHSCSRRSTPHKSATMKERLPLVTSQLIEPRTETDLTRSGRMMQFPLAGGTAANQETRLICGVGFCPKSWRCGTDYSSELRLFGTACGNARGSVQFVPSRVVAHTEARRTIHACRPGRDPVQAHRSEQVLRATRACAGTPMAAHILPSDRDQMLRDDYEHALVVWKMWAQIAVEPRAGQRAEDGHQEHARSCTDQGEHRPRACAGQCPPDAE
jgi:hypothetical protein